MAWKRHELYFYRIVYTEYTNKIPIQSINMGLKIKPIFVKKVCLTCEQIIGLGPLTIVPHQLCTATRDL